MTDDTEVIDRLIGDTWVNDSQLIHDQQIDDRLKDDQQTVIHS